MKTPLLLMFLLILGFPTLGVSMGCGGAAAEGGTTPVQEAPLTPTRDLAEGEITRGDLNAVLDAGLPRFLSGVETEPAMADGQFVGFRLLSFFPDDPALESVELASGDVVTRVNGQSIDRPEHAFTVWSGLRVASELHIEYQRDGQDREVRYVIVD